MGPEHYSAKWLMERPSMSIPKAANPVAGNLPVPDTQVLSFGDNGCQVYFSNAKYLLLNPYLDKGGIRYGGGWSLFSLPECLLVEDPDDHQKSDRRRHFANLSLRAVRALVEEK